MPRTKSETLTLRTTAQIKDLLRLAAEQEHRSVTSMVEVLVLSHAREIGLIPQYPGRTFEALVAGIACAEAAGSAE